MTATLNLITPTIGRKVWFWPNGTHIGVPYIEPPQCQDLKQAMDATIVFVHNDRRVNLLVVDHIGITWPVNSVFLQQEGDATPSGMYAQWMPYQAGQAKKDAAIVDCSDMSARVAESVKNQMAALQQANVGSKTAPDAKCAQGSTAGKVNNGPDNSLRADLIRSLVGAAGHTLVSDPGRAGDIAKGITDLVAAVLNPVPTAGLATDKKQ